MFAQRQVSSGRLFSPPGMELVEELGTSEQSIDGASPPGTALEGLSEGLKTATCWGGYSTQGSVFS